jgi:sigma-B regulation protein RsbU (phosphoserine phosphatase)
MSGNVSIPSNERDILLTLVDLGRQVASEIDFDELLRKIPELLKRLIEFDAFAVYLLDERRNQITIAFAVGYPEAACKGFRLSLSQGIIGHVVRTQETVTVGDVKSDAHYIEVVPGMASTVAVPLVHKGKSIGALNILSRQPDRYSDRDAAILREFAKMLGAAVVNARLYEREKLDADAFETLAKIGREVAAVLDLDDLLTRIAQLARHVIDYRTFGILLLNEDTNELEIKVAVQFAEKVALPKVPLGQGIVGYAAMHREAVVVPDVSNDSRYIKVVDDVRSELAVPMMLKDKCIGVFDLESPELDGFSKRDVEILTMLASQAAVAIENARLYETIRATEARMEMELGFAKRVQAALLPHGLPKKMKGVDVAVSFASARELGGDFHDFLLPDGHTLVIALGDVSGKGAPAAIYSVFAAELVRGRTFRRRYVPERSSPASVLASINTILHERHLEEYYCTLCYAAFDLKKRTVTMANSGLPYPVRASGDGCAEIEVPGVPLGSFQGVTFNEVTLPLANDDVFVFCSDGVTEAMNTQLQLFTAPRLVDVVRESRGLSAREIVANVVGAVDGHRAGHPPNDDTTIVALRLSFV